MHARRGNTLVAFKLATVAFLMPATAGLSAQTPLQWPANSAQRPAVEQTAPGNTALDNYLQQLQYMKFVNPALAKDDAMLVKLFENYWTRLK